MPTPATGTTLKGVPVDTGTNDGRLGSDLCGLDLRWNIVGRPSSAGCRRPSRSWNSWASSSRGSVQVVSSEQ